MKVLIALILIMVCLLLVLVGCSPSNQVYTPDNLTLNTNIVDAEIINIRRLKGYLYLIDIKSHSYVLYESRFGTTMIHAESCVCNYFVLTNK